MTRVNDSSPSFNKPQMVTTIPVLKARKTAMSGCLAAWVDVMRAMSAVGPIVMEVTVPKMAYKKQGTNAE